MRTSYDSKTARVINRRFQLLFYQGILISKDIGVWTICKPDCEFGWLTGSSVLHTSVTMRLSKYCCKRQDLRQLKSQVSCKTGKSASQLDGQDCKARETADKTARVYAVLQLCSPAKWTSPTALLRRIDHILLSHIFAASSSMTRVGW